MECIKFQGLGDSDSLDASDIEIDDNNKSFEENEDRGNPFTIASSLINLIKAQQFYQQFNFNRIN
jgi:hypothetical protein